MRISDWSSDVCSSDLGDIDQACAWFDHHGGKAVFIGRLVPAVRTLISVPAGIAGMDLRRFLFFTALGTLVWTGFLAALGFLLGDKYHRVADWTNPVSNVIIAAIVLWRSEEHTSELQSLMRISYAVFRLSK